MNLQRAAIPAANPLVRKLRNFATFGSDDENAIVRASRDVRRIEAHRDIISDGDRPSQVHLILDGWAARYKIVKDGGRQFTAYLLPGDFCDLHVNVLRHMDHGIAALSAVNVAFISEEDMRELVSRPQLTRALWWATLVDEGVLRAWIVNLGQRNAVDRVANLFCELHVRMRNIGAAPDGVFELPLTQEQLADTLGLSAVHINRTLMRLKADGLIKLGSKTLTILDPAGLRAASGFDDSYLHTERDSARW